MSDEPAFRELVDSIKDIATDLQSLHLQAVRQYTPVVESILRARSRDTRQIDRTLDGLLDFCGSAPALALFKRLCRYYWDIDPAATADHINAYREMWDSDESEETSGATGTAEP